MNAFYGKIDNKEKKEVLGKIEVELIGILDKSLFYRYYDEQFYLKLVAIISDSQDLIFKMLDTLDSGVYREEVIGKKWNTTLAGLYKTMISYYSSV